MTARGVSTNETMKITRSAFNFRDKHWYRLSILLIISDWCYNTYMKLNKEVIARYTPVNMNKDPEALKKFRNEFNKDVKLVPKK